MFPEDGILGLWNMGSLPMAVAGLKGITLTITWLDGLVNFERKDGPLEVSPVSLVCRNLPCNGGQRALPVT